MDFLNPFSVLVISLFSMFIGFVLGGSFADYEVEKKKKEAARIKENAGQVLPAEAYLEGFSDGYNYKESRQALFDQTNFGNKYEEGFNAGREKARAEYDHKDNGGKKIL